jgi:hypothetical protein
MLEGARGIDFYDARMSVRAPQHAGMQHARQFKIQSVVDGTAYPQL